MVLVKNDTKTNNQDSAAERASRSLNLLTVINMMCFSTLRVTASQRFHGSIECNSMQRH